MDIEETRKVVSDAIAAIAPNVAVRRIDPERPLREQIDFDSMDWLNLLGSLQDRLEVDIPQADHGRLTTLDSITGYLASKLAQNSADKPHSIAEASATLPRTFRLLDERVVTLRPICAEDAPLEADFFRRMSPESRYKRFMATMRELPQAKLKYLTQVDGINHVALAATTHHEGRETLVGVARFVVGPASTDCEFAVSVDDAWQGSGVAGILMRTLMELARARGLRRMEGIVLASNGRMLKFMRQLGFSVQTDPDDRRTVRVSRTV